MTKNIKKLLKLLDRTNNEKMKLTLGYLIYALI